MGTANLYSCTRPLKSSQLDLTFCCARQSLSYFVSLFIYLLNKDSLSIYDFLTTPDNPRHLSDPCKRFESIQPFSTRILNKTDIVKGVCYGYFSFVLS